MVASPFDDHPLDDVGQVGVEPVVASLSPRHQLRQRVGDEGGCQCLVEDFSNAAVDVGGNIGVEIFAEDCPYCELDGRPVDRFTRVEYPVLRPAGDRSRAVRRYQIDVAANTCLFEARCDRAALPNMEVAFAVAEAVIEEGVQFVVDASLGAAVRFRDENLVYQVGCVDQIERRGTDVEADDGASSLLGDEEVDWGTD